MVNINFAHTKLDKSKLTSPALSGYIGDSSLLLGIWEGRSLIEVFALSDASNLQSKLAGIQFKDVNFVHQSELFEHVGFDTFEPHKIEQYFLGVDKNQLSKSGIVSEKLKQQKVYSLSGTPSMLKDVEKSTGSKTKSHHISSALANFSLNGKDQMLIHVAGTQMHLMVHMNGKFHQFEMHETNNTNDFLYYILLMAKRLNIKISNIPVSIGGTIDQFSPLYKFLKSHIYHLDFFKSNKYELADKTLPYHYYMPLIIARACA